MITSPQVNGFHCHIPDDAGMHEQWLPEEVVEHADHGGVVARSSLPAVPQDEPYGTDQP